MGQYIEVNSDKIQKPKQILQSLDDLKDALSKRKLVPDKNLKISPDTRPL